MQGDRESGRLIDDVLEGQERSGGLQRRWAMGESALRVLDFYLARYFSPTTGRLRTAQTGCGSATVLFRARGADHVAICADDRAAGGDSARRYFERLCSDVGATDGTCAFVGGPLLEAQPHVGVGALDVVLIDGPHAHPGPEVAFALLASRLRPGGILVLDDITIPTVAALHDVLLADDRFLLHGTYDATAFFWRSDVAFGDERAWWTQRFNAQRFPAKVLHPYRVGARLPWRVDHAGGRVSRLDEHFERGFMLVDGAPVSEGAFSRLRAHVEAPSGACVEVAITVAVADGCGADSVELSVRDTDGVEHGRATVLRRTPQRFAARVPVIDGWVSVDLVRVDLAAARPGQVARQGVLVHTLEVSAPDVADASAVRLDTAGRGWGREGASRGAMPALVRHDGSVVTFHHEGARYRFFVDDPHEAIQAHHARGALYEPEELALCASLLAARGVVRPVVLDVGANIGNHAVFFAIALAARQVIVFEPQARVAELLVLNRALNGADAIDTRYLGTALGARTERGRVTIPQAFNRGGAMVETDQEGDVPIRRGDDVFGTDAADPVRPHLIKVDVEGMELDVLDGLRGVIAAARPLLWVEVWDHQRGAFDALAHDLGYEVVAEHRRYDIATNLFLAGHTPGAAPHRVKDRHAPIPAGG